METVDGFGAISFFSGYGKLAASGPVATAGQVTAKLKAIAVNMKQSPWRRVAATRTLFEMKMAYAEKSQEAGSAEKTALENLVNEIGKMVEDIKAVETEPQIKALYEQFSQ